MSAIQHNSNSHRYGCDHARGECGSRSATAEVAKDSASCGCGYDHDKHNAEAKVAKDSASCGCGQHSDDPGARVEAANDAPSCGCGHDHGEEEGSLKSVSFIVGASLFVIGFVLEHFESAILSVLGGAGASGTATVAATVLPQILHWGPLFILLAAFILIGKDVLLYAGGNILKGHIFDENFLMSIAGIGAFVIGEYPEAVAVMLFYQVGEYLQGRAVQHSRRSISALMDIRPDTANLEAEGGLVQVPAESVAIGEIFIVRPGERVPLDGTVVDGTGAMDMSALTGESLPVNVKPGDALLSGAVNKDGLLKVKTDKLFGESTASRILYLAEHAAEKKAKTENFISVFARWYTPAVCAASALIAILPPVFGFGSFAEWVYKGLIFLVVSCPCALVISIPISFFGGIGAASARGILIKGGNYLEALNRVDTVVFDKTGTLTEGRFRVQSVQPAAGFESAEILRLAALAESGSTHPIAYSIIEYYQGIADRNLVIEESRRAANGQNAAQFEMASGSAEMQSGKIPLQVGTVADTQFGNLSASVDTTGNEERDESVSVSVEAETVTDIVEQAGHGVSARIGGKRILLGNARLLEMSDIKANYSLSQAGTAVHLAVEGRYAGVIVLGDSLRADSTVAVSGLQQRGVKQVYMFTGDARKAAECVAKELGIKSVKAELLPHQKLDALEFLLAEEHQGKIAFMGDGINDAPVLARADVGLAMGGLGSDAAIEAADVVIMNDAPSKLLTAIDIARKTRRIVWENIALSLGVKAVVLALATVGLSGMWEAVFADVGVAVLATLNALRTGRGIK
jgi:Cd2+/Zn2+-exporting ATPase